MHSVHLEFQTVAEMEEFFSQRKPYDAPAMDPMVKVVPAVAFPTTATSTSTSEAYGLLQELLQDPKYEWRKMNTLVEKTGLTSNNIIEHFQKEDVDYEIRPSRDGGQLVKASYSY